MEIAGSAGAGEVVVEIIFLAGAFADAGHVGVLVNVSDQRQPSFASGRAVSGGVAASAFFTGGQNKKAQTRGGKTPPPPRTVPQVSPPPRPSPATPNSPP